MANGDAVETSIANMGDEGPFVKCQETVFSDLSNRPAFFFKIAR
jgi:hypothetical protein